MTRTAASEYRESRTSVSFHQLAKRVVITMMKGLQFGRIEVYDRDKHYIFGNDTSLSATVHVHSPAFYTKVLFGGSIGAGEAFIDNLWSTNDLTTLVRILVRNMEILDKIDKGFSLLLWPLRRAGHLLRGNSRKGAKKNIISHYDLGNEMYGAFLDENMMYSSAIYPRENSSLEEASRHKLDIICEKLKLKPTDRVVEIGTGWGGFAIHAARNYGCHVTTTTISEAQYQEAARRVEKEGLGNRITLLNKDYRELSGKYDKLVSIEMIEAVGHAYLPNFFKKCGELLKDNGSMLLQAITIRDQQYDQYVRSVDFIQRHIFPGGCLPSNTRMLQLLTDKTDMVLRSLNDFGTDYARTLADWRCRFNAAFPALTQYGFDERFKRLWQFYLCYCEGGFLEKSISVVHLHADKPQNR